MASKQFDLRTWTPALSLLAFGIFFLWSLGETAAILFLAFLLVYLVQPMVRWLERKGISRNIAHILTLASAGLGVVILIGLIVPFLTYEAIHLVKDLPENLPPLLDKIRESLPKSLQESFAPYLSWEELADRPWVETLKTNLPRLFQQSRQILKETLLIILTPIFFIYLLWNFEALHRELLKFVPKAHRGTLKDYASELNHRFYAYVRGMAIVSLALAVMYSAGLKLTGVPYGILIGIVGGLLSIIPYLGSALGLFTAIIVTLIYEPSLWMFLGIGLTWSIAQAIESYFLTPKLVGREVGMNPLFVILLVIAGAKLGGFLGMFVAIPLGSFVWFLLEQIRENHQETKNEI